jgi:hypothetical protein
VEIWSDLITKRYTIIITVLWIDGRRVWGYQSYNLNLEIDEGQTQWPKGYIAIYDTLHSKLKIAKNEPH